VLSTSLRTFLDFFSSWFDKVLIPYGKHNSFQPNPRVCVEIYLKKKLSPFISMMNMDGV
jgi:hypothetical protein